MSHSLKAVLRCSDTLVVWILLDCHVPFVLMSALHLGLLPVCVLLVCSGVTPCSGVSSCASCGAGVAGEGTICDTFMGLIRNGACPN